MDNRFPLDRLIPASLFSFFSPNIAEACGVCVMAQLDRILPPIYLRVVFATVWFLSLSVLKRYHSGKIPGIPSLLKALFIVVFLLLAGAVFVGLSGLILLLIPCIGSVIYVWVRGDTLEKRLRYHLKTMSCFWLVCFLILIANSIYIRYTRNDSEYIRQWKGTYPARKLSAGEDKRPDAPSGK